MDKYDRPLLQSLFFLWIQGAELKGPGSLSPLYNVSIAEEGKEQ